MTRRAWLTPDDAPGAVAYAVFVPDNPEMRAALRGALLLLEMPDNWQKLGDLSPEDAAEAWRAANVVTFDMVTC